MPQGKQFRFVRELGDEIVILDDEHAVAHRLDAEAAAVWRACNGRATLPAIAAATGFDPERVGEILIELDGLGLLTKEQPAAPRTHDATRRVVLRRAVIAGAAIGAGLPTVKTIVVPTAAQAFNSQNSDPGNHGSSNSGGGGATTEDSMAGTTPTSGSSIGGGAKGGHSPAGAKGGSSNGPHVKGATETAGARPGLYGDDDLAVAGAGSAIGAGSNGTLPFTGTDVVMRAAIGTGLLAAGIQARRFLREPPPPLP